MTGLVAILACLGCLLFLHRIRRADAAEAARADTVELPAVRPGTILRPAAPDLPQVNAGRRTRRPWGDLDMSERIAFDEITRANPDLCAVDVLRLADLYLLPTREYTRED